MGEAVRVQGVIFIVYEVYETLLTASFALEISEIMIFVIEVIL